MKRITALLAFLFLLGMQVVNAQNRDISGTVTSAADGSPIPGANVVVKGTTNGTVTDFDGKYKLSLPSGQQTLVFSFIGMQSKEVITASSTTIDISLEAESTMLSDVVVTALGISREKKALGYSVQEVSGDAIKQGGQSSVINSLSGRIAGVQVAGASGTMGGSSSIIIRGMSSVSGNNQPLFVVDGISMDNTNFNSNTTAAGGGGYDFGNMAQDINPEDIASVTVLKGPSAAALYGSRAANGVILITTKKGKAGKKGLGISVNSGISFNSVAYMPSYQKLYGGGSVYGETDAVSGFQPITIDGKQFLVPDFATDESWGPKYDPNVKVLAWNSFDKSDKDNYLVAKPWVYPKYNQKDFFETGITYTNNVSVQGSTDKSAYRLSYTNLTENGYMPNSKLKRNTLSLNASSNISDQLEAFTVMNYVRNDAFGRAATGYDDNNVLQKFNQWGQNQVDMHELRDYQNEDGTQRPWNRVAWDDATPNYSDNPYWTRNKNYATDVRDRFYGNIGLKYKVLDWLSVQGKINMDYYNWVAQERVAIGSQAQSSYSQISRTVSEMNSEFLFAANKTFNDFSLSANFGGNRMDRSYFRMVGYTNGGLVVGDLYNLSNSVAPASVTERTELKRINSLYGNATVGYKSLAYLDVTARNDWSSALPSANNSYFYPSVNLSFIVSELPALKNLTWLNHAKVRGGWAQVGNDADPYKLQNEYSSPVNNLGNTNSNFGSIPLYTLPTDLNNPALQPEKTSSIEFGLELKMFNNRLSFDGSYYSNETTNQVLRVATSSATGYAYQWVNAGLLTNKGVELSITGTPVKMRNGLTWDVTLNWSKNTNKVVSLADGVTSYRLGSLFGTEIHAVEGESYPVIKGANYVYDNDGNVVVDVSGRIVNGPIETVAKVTPDWNAGLSNTLSYKGFEFSALLDMQHGGSIFSLTNMWGTYSGILEETAAINGNGKNVRDAVADGGGVLVSGVYGKVVTDATTGKTSVQYLTKDGATSATPVTNSTYISGERWSWDHYSRARTAQNTFSSNYIKLRELKLSYRIPNKLTGPIKDLTVSIYGRNLAIWDRDLKHIDPESVTSASNTQGIEGGQLPSLRTFGFDLKFNF